MRNLYVLYVYQQLAVWQDEAPSSGHELDIMEGKGLSSWWYLTGTDSLWMIPGTYSEA